MPISNQEFSPYAIFGGTFDPPHYGHLRALQQTADLFDLPTIALMPAYIPALKTTVTQAKHRLAMTQILCELDTRLTIDTTEIDAKNNTFTVNTLHQMAKKQPTQKRIFIIGLDSLLNINKWYEWQSIFDYAHVVVMHRPNNSSIEQVIDLDLNIRTNTKLASNLYDFYTSHDEFDRIVGAKMDVSTRQWLLSKLARTECASQCINLSLFKDIISTAVTGNLWFAENQNIALSSTAIRALISQNKSSHQETTLKLMPKGIVNYIKQHQLYA